MGLRERKKAATAQRIIEEASRMFQEKGYENTRIEDVAAKAELSAATFYNYFGSKADILLSCVSTETELVLAEADHCIEQSYDTAAMGFDALVATYFTTSFTKTPRSLWRIAVSQSMLDPRAEFSLRYVEMDNRLSKQCCRFVRVMKEAGLIRAEVPSEPVGELLFNNVNMNFIDYIRSDTLTGEDVRAVVNRQSAPIFDLISM
ncbi:TetR/AcrR family transcriptional regulator [Neptunicoccus cionae]|uniref:TetR/AcrR family transcriptional regulator n=1 Tax=Neptunicoccus cionae TaxID=2035344 RepID=UPI000C775DC9|nr:TetR/AcrR family transcriptional regulator [Amylibacter cionae]PLS22922.1 TetR family transcriptional regulator [Amylibacter cionae]